MDRYFYAKAACCFLHDYVPNERMARYLGATYFVKQLLLFDGVETKLWDINLKALLPQIKSEKVAVVLKDDMFNPYDDNMLAVIVQELLYREPSLRIVIEAKYYVSWEHEVASKLIADTQDVVSSHGRDYLQVRSLSLFRMIMATFTFEEVQGLGNLIRILPLLLLKLNVKKSVCYSTIFLSWCRDKRIYNHENAYKKLLTEIPIYSLEDMDKYLLENKMGGK